MLTLQDLTSITDARKVRLHAMLRQGQTHDFFGTARILTPAGEDPQVRVKLSGVSGKDRPSARAMDPEGKFYIRLGLGSRAVMLKMGLHKVESDDQALFLPQEIEQQEQNRAYFRVQTYFQAKISLKQGQTSQSSFQSGIVLNISGAGLLMRTPEHYKPGTRLEVEFGLEVNAKHVFILCSATVVRCIRAGQNGYDTAVSFDDLLEEQRDVIMAYCFARQREILREKVQTKDYE